MPCETAKSMRFRVYNINQLPAGVFNYLELRIFRSDPKNHFDTGKEFSITTPDDTAPFWKLYFSKDADDDGITDHSVAGVMLMKLYGFQERLGYVVDWVEGKFIAGNIAGIWYIRRLV